MLLQYIKYQNIEKYYILLPTVQDRRELQRPDAQHRKVADKSMTSSP